MKKTLLTLAAAFCYSLMAFAQVPPHRTCGTMEYHEFLKQTRKNYEADFVQYNQMLEQYMKSSQFAAKTNGTAATITIPVVIHVVYNTAVQNISDAQATSQFSVLDNDFNHLNADTVNIPLPFRSVAGKTGIRFCLAQRDPSGNATTGIIHKSTTVTSFITDNKVKSAATGGDDAWDVTKYLNIWVCNLGNSLLGYGEFPTGTLSNTYGLVINYTATGTMGTAAAPFNKGRTGTHEFGHCFNLNHIWGDNGQCGNTDNCTDTPPQKGGTTAPAGCNYGTPTYPWQPNTCTRPDGVAGANVTNTNGDMFMNFMDYTDDASMNMFSKEQCLRMLAVVNTAPWNVLQSSLGCTPVSALDAGITSVIAPVNGSSSCNTSVTPKITLTNVGSTTLTSAKILYKMDALATQTLNWSGSLASGTSTILTLNAYAGLTNASHTFSASVTAPNAGTDANAANNTMTSTFSVIAVPAGSALPFVERFDAVTFPPTGWAKISANTADATATWTRLANTTGIPVVPTTTACAKMDNFAGSIDISGQLDALRTPALSFTGANSSLNVTFDVSHKMYSATDIDTLNVFISTDCGGTWTNLYTKGGNQLTTSVGTQTTAFTPTANAQWRRETVSLTAYAGLASVYLKFESRSGWGNNVYLDNVNVSYTSAAVPVASFTSAATKCSGSAITFSDQSTNTPTSWNWSFPGGTPSTATTQNPSITYTAGGTYTVTLSSANASGTSTPVSQTITVNATPTVVVTNTTICSGTAANLSATGATTYSWNTGAGTSTISITPTITTNYTVTGTTTGCTNTKTVSVTVNATPTVTAVSNPTTLCVGSTATLTAGGASTYTWNPGALTGLTVVVSPTATTIYTVVGTSSLGCTGTKTVNLTVISNPTITATTSGTITCTSPTANVIANGASTYTWSGAGISSGANSATATINSPGTFTITGTSVAGCTNTATTSVSMNTVIPTVTVSGTQTVTCAAPTVTLVGSAIPSTCSPVWTGGVSSGANSYTATASSANIYTLTVTNPANGCVNTITTQVVSSAGMPSIVASVTNSLSCASLTAQVVATTTSTPVSYSWTGPSIISGATTASATVNGPGTYTVVVTNTASACSTTLTIGVTQNIVSPSVAGATSGTLTCTTLTVNANATTTTTPVSYNWSGTGITSSTTTGTITINQPGVFTYTVTNTSNGCNTTGTRTVTQNTLTPTVSGATSGTLSCTTLTVKASATTTTSPVSYTWSGTGITAGAGTGSVTVNQPGTFNYTVTNTANGCKTTGSQVVTQNISLPTVASSTSGTITCLTTTATAMVSTTTTPVSYNWSGSGITSGVGTPSITVNQGGTFNYTVTNTANGCNATGSQVVTQNISSPSVTSGTSGSLDCVTTTADAMVSTTTTPVSYNWSGSGITSGITTATITVNQGGTFNYTVTNTSNGCSSTGSQAVTQNTVSPTVSVSSATICSGSTGTITASGSAATYSWNTGATGANFTDNPISNANYTVTATATNGCINTAIGSISVGSAPSISVNSATICSGSTVTLTATGVTTYTWSTTSNAASISVNPTSTAVYTVTGNLTGCAASAIQTATVTVNLLPNVTLGAIAGPLCVSNAAVTLSGSPAGGIYSGAGVSGSSFDPASSGAGTFTLTYDYTDVNTCSASATQTVSVSLCTGFVTLSGADAFSISVYPNPANDFINVVMDASFINNTTTIELYDAIGKLLISEKVANTNTSVVINSLSTGIYTLRVVADGKQISKRIIKE